MSRSQDIPVPGSELTTEWAVENVSFFAAKENNKLISRTFSNPFLGSSEWYLKLLWNRSQGKLSIMCFLQRNEKGPDNIRVFYSLSVKSSYAAEFQTFARNSPCAMPAVINHEEFINNVKLGLAKDVLRIECRLRPSVTTDVPAGTPASPYPVFFSTRTVIGVEHRSFFYEVKNFSSRRLEDMFSIVLPSGNAESVKLVCRLWMENEEFKMTVREEQVSEQDQMVVLKCKIDFLDMFNARHTMFRGQSLFSGIGNGPTWSFRFPLSYEEMIEKKDLYLPNDVLLLHCEFAMSTKSSVDLIETTRYDTSDLKTVSRYSWGMYVDHKYNEHRYLYRLLAVLVVILSFLPHFFNDSTV